MERNVFEYWDKKEKYIPSWQRLLPCDSKITHDGGIKVDYHFENRLSSKKTISANIKIINSQPWIWNWS